MNWNRNHSWFKTPFKAIYCILVCGIWVIPVIYSCKTREAETLGVVCARCLLVDIVATEGLVLQVLHRLPAQVGNPRGGAEMVWVEEIGELGCRVRLGQAVKCIKSVAVDTQWIRCHHAAQQRVAFHALVGQHVAINNRLANVGQATVADGRGP